MNRYAVAIVIIGLAFGQRRNITYEDCGSSAQILSAQMEPCDSDPCILRRRATTMVRYSLISDQDSDTATVDARVNFLGLNVRVPGLEKDLCKEVVHCPIIKGQTYDGIMKVHIPWFVPPMKRSVSVKILGDKGLSICLNMNVTIR
ncbi:mite group 2 allergen-like Ixo r 2 [Dermacentor variabilis]|uniref:mite group 2 allergen-like Ixo r 2 n=1 Tax=Dermacentor variabilis TaxID=34621 RepID=UPI003F5C4CA0